MDQQRGSATSDGGFSYRDDIGLARAGVPGPAC